MSETPGTIPDDIDRIATDIVRTRYSEDVGEAEYLLYEAIAKAILAERERCAGKVRRKSDFYLPGGPIDMKAVFRNLSDELMSGE